MARTNKLLDYWFIIPFLLPLYDLQADKNVCLDGWLMGKSSHCDWPDCSNCIDIDHCQRNLTCKECERGWEQGELMRCRKHTCAACKGGKCDANGRCQACVYGWKLGPLSDCSERDCTRCQVPIGQCNQNNKCKECKPYWRSGKLGRCLLPNCDGCKDGVCTDPARATCRVCKPGYVLTNSSRCQSLCTNCARNNCELDTGACHFGCKPGWVPGEDRTCSTPDCHRCVQEKCQDVENNTCTECLHGWHLGEDMRCSAFDCSHCENGSCADKKTGTCRNCKVGWRMGKYNRCTQSTCENCLRGQCKDTKNGTCDGCIPGWLPGPETTCDVPDCRNCRGGQCKGEGALAVCEACVGGLELGRNSRCTSKVCPHGCLKEYCQVNSSSCWKCAPHFVLDRFNICIAATPQTQSDDEWTAEYVLVYFFPIVAVLAFLGAMINLCPGVKLRMTGEETHHAHPADFADHNGFADTLRFKDAEGQVVVRGKKKNRSSTPVDMDTSDSEDDGSGTSGDTDTDSL